MVYSSTLELRFCLGPYVLYPFSSVFCQFILQTVHPILRWVYVAYAVSLYTRFRRPEEPHFHRLHSAFLPFGEQPWFSTVTQRSYRYGFEQFNSCVFPCFTQKNRFIAPQTWLNLLIFISWIPHIIIRNLATQITDIVYLLSNLILYD